MATNEYLTAAHALAYLASADAIPHRSDGEAVLLEIVPAGARRILDLGTGDGRLLARLLVDRPEAAGVATDFSPTMIAAVRTRFAVNGRVEIVAHDLDRPLPDIGVFDVIVSSFAIHHCEDDRKQEIFREIFDRLEPGGVFCNLEHVAPGSAALHERFYRALGKTIADEDPSNRLATVEAQIQWLRRTGFVDVDCYWKWMELALLGGWKPLVPDRSSGRPAPSIPTFSGSSPDRSAGS